MNELWIAFLEWNKANAMSPAEVFYSGMFTLAFGGVVISTKAISIYRKWRAAMLP